MLPVSGPGAALGKEEAREKRAVIQPSLTAPLWLQPAFPIQAERPTLPHQLPVVFHLRRIRRWYGETRRVVSTSFSRFPVFWAEPLESRRNDRSSSKIRAESSTPELSNQSFRHKEQEKKQMVRVKGGSTRGRDHKWLIKHERQSERRHRRNVDPGATDGGVRAQRCDVIDELRELRCWLFPTFP